MSPNIFSPQSTSRKNLIYIFWGRSFSLSRFRLETLSRASRNFRIFQYFVTDSQVESTFDVGFRVHVRKLIFWQVSENEYRYWNCGSFNTLTSTDVTLTTAKRSLLKPDTGTLTTLP